MIAWLVGAVAFIAVVLIQQGVFEPKASPVQGPTSALTAPAPGDPFIQSAKMIIRFKAFAGPTTPAEGQQMLDFVGKPGPSKVDRFRFAIVTAELAGSEAARKALDELDQSQPSTGTNTLSAEEEQRLSDQIAAVRSILDGNASKLTSDQREALITDHGYLGQLILTIGKPNNDPERAPLVDGAIYTILLVVYFFVIAFVGIVGGIAACVLFFVMLGSGRITRRFVAPTPGGSVYLETAALFLSAFLILQVFTHVVLGPDAIKVKLLSQWLLLLVPLWPLARGVASKEWREQLGLHTGKGFWREVGTGIFAYFAAIPFLLVAIAIVLAYTLIKSHNDPAAGPPSNPIQELVGQADTATLVLVFLLATVWAPLTEEMIFRGALFRHLRGRMGMLAAAAISALTFGFMHGYALPLLLPVVTIGFTFALTREWRGSLIAPIVGHFLHNATLLTLAILLVQAGK